MSNTFVLFLYHFHDNMEMPPRRRGRHCPCFLPLARSATKKKSKLPLHLRLGAVLGRVLLPIWFVASPPVYIAPPSRLTCHELLHSLRAHGIVVRRLIVLFGPVFRVSYATEVLPGSTVVTSLRDCISLRELISGSFRLVDAPPPHITVPPSETFSPPWSPSRG